MASEIIIAEKPKQADAIKKATDGITTIPAAGHLLGLKPKKRLWEPPYFDLEWVTPNKKTAEKLDKMIKKLKAADDVIIGTDFDAEGQLIAYNILQQAGIDPKTVKRMKFSSLEHDELRHAYDNPIDFDILMAKSAEVRHRLDWSFGMNISKALTIRMKRDIDVEKGYYLTPVGRVQTPVLNYLALLETEILEFMGKDEWRVLIYAVKSDENTVFELDGYYLDTEREVELLIRYDRGLVYKITAIKEEKSFLPPNKDHVVKECLKEGIGPEIVDRVMQGLYLDGFISYPRTTSKNYTSHNIDTFKYLDNLEIDDLDFKFDTGGFIDPNEEKPEGPHPAIYPIKHYHDRDIGRLVWDVIVKSFVKCHLPPEEYLRRTMEVHIGKYRVETKNDADIDGCKEDELLEIYFDVKKQKTTPPRRYDLKKVYEFMIKNQLGTVDTRTQILSKIMRTYVFETNDGLFTSGKGVKITNILRDICPELISVDLTQKFEEHVKSIQKDDSNIDKILDEAKETVSKIVGDILK